MTRDEARSILTRHRPDTSDAEDPDVAEALRLAQSDTELGQWLAGFQESQEAIRQAFAGIRPPAGLKEQILAEKPRPTRARSMNWRHAIPGVTILAVVGLIALWLNHAERTPFERFSIRMVKTAMRTYAMDLATGDADKAQAFLAQAGAPADYTLPEGLARATFVGCSALEFDGRPVTLLCYQSGRTLPRGEQSDLWLFVVGTDDIIGVPEVTQPQISTQGVASVAVWSEAGRTYLLVTSGTEANLRELL